MKKIILGTMLTAFITPSFADNLIITETNSWKRFPITVDENSKTYATDKEFLIPEGNYYFSYSNYRCLVNKFDRVSEDPLVLKPTISTGKEIYCYKEN